MTSHICVHEPVRGRTDVGHNRRGYVQDGRSDDRGRALGRSMDCDCPLQASTPPDLLQSVTSLNIHHLLFPASFQPLMQTPSSLFKDASIPRHPHPQPQPHPRKLILTLPSPTSALQHSVFFILISVLVVIFIEPAAASSGIPETMAFLNGVRGFFSPPITVQ